MFELLQTACSSYLLSIASGSVGNFLTNSLKLVNIDDMHMILICTMGLKSRSPHSVKSCLFVGCRPRFRSIKSHQWSLHPSFYLLIHDIFRFLRNPWNLWSLGHLFVMVWIVGHLRASFFPLLFLLFLGPWQNCSAGSGLLNKEFHRLCQE